MPYLSTKTSSNCFNTQPPEGGWTARHELTDSDAVSTHSRLKAAGQAKDVARRRVLVSTHSRLKAAGS